MWDTLLVATGQHFLMGGHCGLAQTHITNLKSCLMCWLIEQLCKWYILHLLRTQLGLWGHVNTEQPPKGDSEGTGTGDEPSLYLFTTCHFFSAWLTSCHKYVLKDSGKKKTKKKMHLLFFFLCHMQLTDQTDFSMRFSQIAECRV